MAIKMSSHDSTMAGISVIIISEILKRYAMIFFELIIRKFEACLFAKNQKVISCLGLMIE